ncbi:MAG: HAMP domain-containing sensor histidine kinase [Thermoleophilia bacterium]
MGALHRLPLRARLVAGFSGAMLLVLIAAGAFVFWRVQHALDDGLGGDLRDQTADLRDAAARTDPRSALAELGSRGRDAQVLDRSGRVVAAGPDVSGAPLLTPAEVAAALRGTVRAERGSMFSGRGTHLRVLAEPVTGDGTAAIAVTAVRLDQRDEALGELLAQLAVANGVALLVASFVGYRLARAALDPVERYRAAATRIAAGATGLRLDVPDGPSDEVTRLGGTLNAMLDAQERSAERQRRFVDDASHELRTPLTTLSAEVDLALRKPRDTGEYEAALRRVRDGVDRLNGLAETLLTMGALGASPPDARPFPVADALRTAVARASAQLPPERAVTSTCPEGLQVTADARLLDMALGNLVDNAVRHGAGTVTVSAEPVPGAVALWVHDEGPGIAPEFVPQAARRFRRAEVSRSSPGSGLGLALAEGVAEAHGGSLRVCSGAVHHHPGGDAPPCRHPGTGTTVTLLLLKPPGPAVVLR